MHRFWKVTKRRPFVKWIPAFDAERALYHHRFGGLPCTVPGSRTAPFMFFLTQSRDPPKKFHSEKDNLGQFVGISDKLDSKKVYDFQYVIYFRTNGIKIANPSPRHDLLRAE